MKKNWMEAFGLLAVLAGLLFVGLEIRQNTKAVEGATVQAAADMMMEVILRGFDDPVIQSSWADVMGGKSRQEFGAAELQKIGWFFTALIRVEQNRFRQIMLGTISDGRLVDFSNDYLRYRAFREWWEWSKSAGNYDYDDGFIKYLDNKIEKSGPVWTRNQPD